MSFLRSLSVFASSLLMSAAVLAAVPEQAAITQKLQASLPSLQVKTIEETPVKGLYQLETTTGELILVSADGKYLVSGDLHRLEARGVTNLTEERRSAQRLDAIKHLNDKDLVVFQAKGEEKGEVLVFTDTSCGYCRKFHAEVPELNNMGITVKYAAWPRAGLQSPAGQTMANVWCAKDRLGAMTKAKTNQDVPAVATCNQNVIQDQINLGHQMGIQGTPAVFLNDGRQVGGYLPAPQLAAQLGIKPVTQGNPVSPR